jgi:hypothetical protein
MTDVRSKLRGVGERVTPPERAFERMVERRERKRRTKRVASAAFALALAIVIVGGTVSVLSGLARVPVQTGSGDDIRRVGPREAVSDLQACIEEAGYDWDEVRPVWDSPEHPPEGSVFADDAFWHAWEVCVVESGAVAPFTKERIAAENHEVREYVRCMRGRGWKLPDPKTWEGPYHPGLLDPPIRVPEDPGEADQYYLDSTDCGYSFYDENDNLLPQGDSEP